MSEEMTSVHYLLHLTGSKFFDTVVYMKALELTKAYPGMTVTVEEDNMLRISGTLEQSGAARLREELGFYGTDD